MTNGYTMKSVELTDGELEKINAFTRTAFDADRLYAFTVTLCNNDIDRDYERFDKAALEKLSELFIGKTGIKNHSMKTQDQTARIYETWVEKEDGRKTSDGEDLYSLKAKAYMVRTSQNENLITEIEAGIKKEVSVSCKMGKNICSVCGVDKKSESCPHTPGKRYDSKTAFVTLTDAKDAYEFSFVAVPAQREAGVTKSLKNIKRETLNMNDTIKALRECEDGIVLEKTQADSLLAYIDDLESDAQLGREYKKSLVDEVTRLCAVAMPKMNIKTFRGVADVMTASELKAFKTAFIKNNYEKTASRQIKSESADDGQFNQFKL